MLSKQATKPLSSSTIWTTQSTYQYLGFFVLIYPLYYDVYSNSRLVYLQWLAIGQITWRTCSCINLYVVLITVDWLLETFPQGQPTVEIWRTATKKRPFLSLPLYLDARFLFQGQVILLLRLNFVALLKISVYLMHVWYLTIVLWSFCFIINQLGYQQCKNLTENAFLKKW